MNLDGWPAGTSSGEERMKSTILRILIGAVVSSLVSAIVVLIIGLLRAWQTSTQFGDGFFWAGAILISIGFISLMGYSQRPIAWPPVRSDTADRAKLWAADLFHGRALMAVFGTAGLVLFGLSVLVSSLF